MARVALLSKSKGIPIAIKNTYSLWPRHKKFPKIKRIAKINIGKPIDFSNYNKKISKRILRQITNKIMGKIKQLYLNMD